MVKRLLPILLLVVAALPAQAVKSYDEYVQQLQQHLEFGDERRLDRLVKANSAFTVKHFRGLVVGALRDPSKTDRSQRDALQASWQRCFESDTLERLDRWLQQLSTSAMNADEKAVNALYQGYAEFRRLKDNAVSDRAPWEGLRDSLMNIAKAFESTGNALDAAETWGLIAQVYASMPDRSTTDRREGIFAINRFKEHREAWAFTNDPFFAQNVNWMEAEKERLEAEEKDAAKREAEGYGGDVKGVDAYLMPDADANEIAVPLEFETIDLGKVDMHPKGGPVPLMWYAVRVEGETPAKLPFFKARDLFLVRTGATRYGIALEGGPEVVQEEKYVPIEVKNRVKEPSVFWLDAERQKPYAMWFWVGGQQETFQGINQNLAPTPEAASVYYKSATSYRTEVDGTDVVFFDDNANGELFEDPRAVGLQDRHVGDGPDHPVVVPMFDTMKIGKSAVQPLSEWVKIDETWYHVRKKDDGQVGFRRANPEYLKTGSLQLDWGGGRKLSPAVLVVEGVGDFSGARFDLSSGKPVEVPAGEYRLAYGRIESGSGARVMTANVFRGTAEPVTVEAGKTVKLALGAPFVLDFERGGSATAVEIDAHKIRVRGRGGEIYTHVNGATPEPEVLVGKRNDGKGAKAVAEFVMIPDGDLLNQVASRNPTLSIEVGFYPVPKDAEPGATVLKLEVPEGQFVGLQEQKNKLFGKLQPIFK